MARKKNVSVEIAPLNAATTRELVQDPLDDKELRAVLGKHAKIVPYHKLSEYSSIDELLPKPKDAVVLLYENRPMDGHWVAITKNNGEISFFDPYGEVIDKQLKYSNYSKQRVQGEGDTSLHNLLYTSKLPVFFNDYKYQRDGGGVNTCGRHVVNFIRYNLNEGLDLEDYNEMMMKTQKETGIPYDELIAKMVPIHIPHPEDAMRQASSADIAQQRGLGGARPLNPSLWEEVKAYTRTRFPKWSAYASGFASKIYKERGGKWEDDGKGRPLKRWFKEVWTDVGGKDYPVYRPTKRVSKKTPLTASEISPTNLRKQTALKQRIRGEKNLPAFSTGRGFLDDMKEKFNSRGKTPEQIEREKAYQQNNEDAMRGIPPTVEFMTRWLNDRTPSQQERALKGMSRDEFLAKVGANYKRWQNSVGVRKPVGTNKFAEGVKGFIDAFDPSTYGRGRGADLEENVYSGGIRGVVW